MIPITDPNDPRLAPYTQIRERDLVGRQDRFIAEGKVTLATLLQRSRFAVESVFLCETRLGPLADLLARAPNEVAVYVAPQAIMDAVAGFPMHRGVLACGLKGEPLQAEEVYRLKRPGPSVVVCAIGLSNHDNIGALFRNAAAFGAAGVLLDAESGDPLYRKSIRVSAGTTLWLPYAHSDTGEAMAAALAEAGYTLWALTPRPGCQPIWSADIPQRLAIMVGAEGPGLPDHILDMAMPIGIPMATGFDSVNVATAAAIALAHVFGAGSHSR
ncbi:MAG: RNA methyltransferase [Pseudomonadota bacterium]